MADETSGNVAASESAASIKESSSPPECYGIILFYKYHDLSSDPHGYRKCLDTLCQSLYLSARILVASEGINGTWAGTLEQVRPEANFSSDPGGCSSNISNQAVSKVVAKFQMDSRASFECIGQSPLCMLAGSFKWSNSSQINSLFPDLNIKVVKELIGLGGIMLSIPLEEMAKGYLTPQQWHAKLTAAFQEDNAKRSDTVLIDCCNTK